MRTIKDIIRDCGGPKAIVDATARNGQKLSVWAIHKWPHIGIPDRHWPLVMALSEASPDELYAANCEARQAA